MIDHGAWWLEAEEHMARVKGEKPFDDYAEEIRRVERFNRITAEEPDDDCQD